MTSSLILFFVQLSGYNSPFCNKTRPVHTTGIKAIDFCNLQYPGPKSGSDNSDLTTFPSRGFKLHKGVQPPQEEGGSLITLEEIRYADLTRDGQQQAIVTLTWHSGGAMQLGMVYVWTMQRNAPIVLSDFVGGDRGFGGLHKVYANDGDLVLEIDDPDAAEGNCCSRQIIRTRYRWNGNKFIQRGERQILPHPSYKVVPTPRPKSH